MRSKLRETQQRLFMGSSGAPPSLEIRMFFPPGIGKGHLPREGLRLASENKGEIR